MNTIEISPEVEALFHKHGKFGESHDDVLKRVFAKYEASQTVQVGAVSPPPTKKTLDSRDSLKMERLVLHMVTQAGGIVLASKAMACIARNFDWTAYDKETYQSTGRERWRANVHNACHRLRRRGLMKPPKEGFWEITDTGRALCRALGIVVQNSASTNAA